MSMTTDSRTPCRLSFQPSPDRSRPHMIDGAYREDAAVIRYSYTDNGEQVCVPNTWNNRPLEQRAEENGRLADAAERRAIDLEGNPPEGIEPEAVQSIVAHYRQKAARLRSKVKTATICATQA